MNWLKLEEVACVDCVVGAGPDCAHAPRHNIIIPSAVTSLGWKIPAALNTSTPQFPLRQSFVSLTIVRPFFDGPA
jgi:hypothetical protein